MTDSMLISARNLVREYQGDGTKYIALRGVDLDVRAGQFVALMGPSGCGKSTLLSMLGGIDRPTSGEVWVDGQRIDQLTETRLALFRRQYIGIVFQFFNLIHNLDVRSNIQLPALLAGVEATEIRRRYQHLTETLSIDGLAQKMPAQLSGGQRQRVAIARALINRPPVLLGDEPTGALDQETGHIVLELFRALNEQGQTIVMVTHDPKVAEFAQQIFYMQDGSIVEHPRGSAATGPLAQRLLGQ